MTEPPPNPYESPSLAASNEAAQQTTALAERERATVELFVSINRIVAGVLIGLGLLVLFSAGLGFAGATMARSPQLFVIPAVILMVAGVLITWGVLQGRKHLLAILATAAVSLMILGGICVGFVVAPPQTKGDVPLIVLVPFSLALMGFIFGPPIWVAIQAIGWVRRGVRLSELPRAVYEKQFSSNGSVTRKQP